MTTLDDVERTFDAETVLVCDRERPLGDRRDHGRPGLRGLRGDDPGPARGRQLERDQHPPHLAAAGAALGGLGALREAAAPGAGDAGAADRLAAAGRALRREAGAGDDRRRRRDRRRRGGCRCGPRGSRACWGWRSPRPTSRPTWSGSASRSRPDGEDLEVVVPPDRHYDVTREVDLIEEVARVHGIDEHLPTTLPAVGGAVGGLSREQRLRRRAEDALRDLGFDQVGRLELHRPRRGRAAADPRRRPAGEAGPARQPALRGAVGDADDPARLPARHRRPQRRPRRRRASPSSNPARVYLQSTAPSADESAVDPLAGSSPAISRRRSRSRTGSPGSRSGRWRRAPGAAAARPADFFALKGVLEALAAQLGVELDFAPAEEPFLHPGRVGRGLGRRRRRRLARRGAPAGLPDLGPRRRGRLRTRRGAAARAPRRSARRPTRTSPPSRPSTRTWPWSCPAEVARQPRSARRCSPAAASCCARPRSSTSTRASSSARAARAWRSASSSAPPDRTLTDEEVAGLREAIKAKLDEIGGTLRE